MTIEDYNGKKTQPNILEDSKHIFKIFNKYVQSSREQAAKRLKVYTQSFQNVKRNNEVKLLNLNQGLKELNYLISDKYKLIKDLSFFNNDTLLINFDENTTSKIIFNTSRDRKKDTNGLSAGAILVMILVIVFILAINFKLYYF